jgi:hypothetical protein
MAAPVSRAEQAARLADATTRELRMGWGRSGASPLHGAPPSYSGVHGPLAMHGDDSQLWRSSSSLCMSCAMDWRCYM